MDDLYETLNRWCTASSAKFNIQKTEIIPIGTTEYRNKFYETRCISDTATEIPHHTHIAKEGEPV
jgi:hypothetical protein